MSHEGAQHVINIVQIARKTFFIEESCCWESFACTSINTSVLRSTYSPGMHIKRVQTPGVGTRLPSQT